MYGLFRITFHGLGEAHHAVSLALKNAVTGTSRNFSIDYTKLIISQGSVYGASQIISTKTTGTSVKVDWVSSLFPTSSLAIDNVNLIFFNEVQNPKLILLFALKLSTKINSISYANGWQLIPSITDLHCQISSPCPEHNKLSRCMHRLKNIK